MYNTVKISVSENIEALEKSIRGYNYLTTIARSITETFYLEDIETRKTDSKVTKKILTVLDKYSRTINSDLVQELFESLIKIVRDGFIDEIDSILENLEDVNQCDFLLNPFKTQLQQEREEIHKLITDENWKIESNYHLILRICNIFEYFDRSCTSEKHEILDNICINIFTFGCKIRDDLIHKADEMKVQITLNNE